MEDIIKIVKSLEDPGLLLKRVRESVQNKAKEQKGGVLSMLLGTLGASLFGNILAGKEMNRAAEGVIRDEDGAITKRQGRRRNRAGYGSAIKNKDF